MDNLDKEITGNEPAPNIPECNCDKSRGCIKLETFDWLNNIPESMIKTDIVEVRFKNTRKEFFHNANGLRLNQGDIVAVEASPGHDIGIVSLTGDLVKIQLRKHGLNIQEHEFKKIYRKAKPADLEKWYEATSLEDSTMLKTRTIASDLKLDMKIALVLSP